MFQFDSFCAKHAKGDGPFRTIIGKGITRKQDKMKTGKTLRRERGVFFFASQKQYKTINKLIAVRRE